jgi:hypothetical protein
LVVAVMGCKGSHKLGTLHSRLPGQGSCRLPLGAPYVQDNINRAAIILQLLLRVKQNSLPTAKRLAWG